MKVFLATIVAFTLVASAYGEDFSCALGRRGACLSYGDTVCSSAGKCVQQDAICFQPYTCGFGGFVCKSKLDDVVDEYNSLADTNRSLVADYNDLTERFNALLRTSKSLSDDYDELTVKHRRSRDCVTYASTLEEAQGCAF